jgi:[ribosomal protein S5]-alanine N-acetyltransferase
MKILTPRLELVPATVEIITADLLRRDELPRLLNAPPAVGWPPPLYEVTAMEWTLRALTDDPARGGWTTWYWLLRRPRLLVGIAGFKSRPCEGVVEIGYSVVPFFQRRGLATEAVRALVQWAFANGVERVFAETLPELIASQRVLLKCDFTSTGEGSEPVILRFDRRRQ